jgi:hypothetical protein
MLRHGKPKDMLSTFEIPAKSFISNSQIPTSKRKWILRLNKSSAKGAVVYIKTSCPGTGRGGRQCVSPHLFLLGPVNLTSQFVQDIIVQDPATHGSTFVPIILGSDKTTVSVATGQNEYYPLYMSNGLVHNGVRRAHRNAVTLIGFLAIPKSALLLPICDLH